MIALAKLIDALTAQNRELKAENACLEFENACLEAMADSAQDHVEALEAAIAELVSELEHTASELKHYQERNDKQAQTIVSFMSETDELKATVASYKALVDTLTYRTPSRGCCPDCEC